DPPCCCVVAGQSRANLHRAGRGRRRPGAQEPKSICWQEATRITANTSPAVCFRPPVVRLKRKHLPGQKTRDGAFAGTSAFPQFSSNRRHSEQAAWLLGVDLLELVGH